MFKKPLTFIFFGTVGSGKGTQAELLKKYIIEKEISNDVIYLSTGVEYRTLLSKDNYTAKIIKKTLEKGFLQPDFLTVSLFANTLISHVKENSFLITDGFPRTIKQSKEFEEAMNFYGRNNIHIIYIELDKEEATNRMMKRGRSDDTPDSIEKRFDEYVSNVIPSMNYFKNNEFYTIHTINGKQTIENVHLDIIKSLNF